MYLRDRHSSTRDFRPHSVAGWEASAWRLYYERRWLRLTAAIFLLTKEVFGLSSRQTLRCALYAARANRAWAPVGAAHDGDRANELMAQFYAVVTRRHGLALDVERLASLEVRWWGEHRVMQNEGGTTNSSGLTDAIASLYSYFYSVDKSTVWAAAHLRAEAMQLSDSWVWSGGGSRDPRLRKIAHVLNGSYTELSSALRPSI